MSKALDADVVLRHFTGQPPEMAARATAALVEAAPRCLVLADLTVAEIVDVLQGPPGPWARWRASSGQPFFSLQDVPCQITYERVRPFRWSHLSPSSASAPLRRTRWLMVPAGSMAGQACRTGDLPAVTVAPPSYAVEIIGQESFRW